MWCFMRVRKLASSRCNLHYEAIPIQEKRLYISYPLSLAVLFSPSSITVLCTLHCRLIHQFSALCVPHSNLLLPTLPPYLMEYPSLCIIISSSRLHQVFPFV